MHCGAFVALDTNILIGRLETVRSLCFLIESINVALFIPCTVIRELDSNKARNPCARAAILFIEQENARTNRKIFIEPAVQVKAAGNCDDAIILSCKENRIPLLLSDDTALRLKANNAGYKLCSIAVENKSASSVFEEIISFFGIHFMDCEMKDDSVGPIKRLTAQAASAIYREKVLPAAERELGNEMLVFYLPPGLDLSLSALLKYVLKNSHLFESFLSRSSIRMLSKIASKKVEDKDVQLILDIFGVSLPGY